MCFPYWSVTNGYSEWLLPLRKYTWVACWRGGHALSLQDRTWLGNFSASYERHGLRLPSTKSRTGWTFSLKGWIWLPTKIKGTIDIHFNGRRYCSVTLASIGQSQCWVSVTVLRESWVIFWEVEHFQKEVWRTPCGLGHFPRVGAIGLNVSLLSLPAGAWRGVCAPCPESFTARSWLHGGSWPVGSGGTQVIRSMHLVIDA